MNLPAAINIFKRILLFIYSNALGQTEK